MKILIITGPPYSGKGTQCEIIEKQLGLKHISTGDRCRLEKKNETSIGLTMSAYEEKGELVPDEIMKALFGQILEENKNASGILLDGYPRTSPQVADLLELVTEKQMKIDQVLSIEVAEEELLKRAAERAKNSTRKDDQNIETHIKRIRVFEEQTRPAIAKLKTQLHVDEINGMGSIAEITQRIQNKLR